MMVTVTIPVTLDHPEFVRRNMDEMSQQVTEWLIDNGYLDEGDTYTLNDFTSEMTIDVAVEVFKPRGQKRKQRRRAKRG